MKKTHFAVAIDGPSGAGKSTIAKAVAAKLSIVYVDTGALYRTIGLAVQRRGISMEDAAGILSVLPQIRVELVYRGGSQRVLLDGEDVSGLIRTPEISMYASKVSALPAVRAFLLDLQREMAREHSVVMDGRDIGTVILPDAEVKIFLTASDEKRAERRWHELCEKGEQVTVEDVLSDMRRRDAQDSTRAAAPLRQAEDAVLVDTSTLSLEESIQAVLDVIIGKLA